MEHLWGCLFQGSAPVSRHMGTLIRRRSEPMAFVQIASAEDIFDVLDNDSEFSSYVGELQFTDGPAQALLVAVAASPLQGTDGASGLLVVIEKDPQVTSTRLLTNQVVIDRMFSIRLIQFPGASRTMRAATERLMQIFPGSSAVPLGAPDAISGEGQSVVKLPKNPVAST